MDTSIIRSAAPPSLSTEVIVLLRVKSRKSLQQNNLAANGLPRWDSFKKRENSGPVMLQGRLSAPEQRVRVWEPALRVLVCSALDQKGSAPRPDRMLLESAPRVRDSLSVSQWNGDFPPTMPLLTPYCCWRLSPGD